MELIPILATIILVATISTFVLAVGAYILYKIREKRGTSVAVEQPSTIQAELITPELVQEAVAAVEKSKAPGQLIFDTQKAPNYRPSIPAEPIFVQQKSATPAPKPMAKPSPVLQPVVASVQKQPQRAVQGPSEQKFMTFTADGYVPAKEKAKTPGALKWR